MQVNQQFSMKEKQADAFAGLRFANSYARLPERFYARLDPIPVRNPTLIRINHLLADELGLNAEELSSDQGVAMLSGNEVPGGAEPVATAYAGHQFGNFVPQLGDGRAILLGEIIDRHGKRRDIQFKGSGRTPFSRQGDGRAALGPVIREYIVSEAMHALGIPTTRSLAAVTTGEPVFRETALPGAILTRVAASHVRVGTFEYFAARKDNEAVKHLADYVIDRHYPHVKEAQNPYCALFEAVRDAQVSLVASWLHVGFIHGVMNTDNMAISGETIDYGPCAFLDTYDPATVFSSIDYYGRYAYGNQGPIAQWNLIRFGVTLLPLLDADRETAIAMVQAMVESFSAVFNRAWLSGMRRKIGLLTDNDADLTLIQDFLGLLQKQTADYTLTFRYLCDAADDDTDDRRLREVFATCQEIEAWLARWRTRISQEKETPVQRAVAMRQVNPAFIPRNHRVEQAIEAAVAACDFTKMDTLITVLSRPYDDQPAFQDYMNPPKPEERVYQTFCGT